MKSTLVNMAAVLFGDHARRFGGGGRREHDHRRADRSRPRQAATTSPRCAACCRRSTETAAEDADASTRLPDRGAYGTFGRGRPAGRLCRGVGEQERFRRRDPHGGRASTPDGDVCSTSTCWKQSGDARAWERRWPTRATRCFAQRRGPQSRRAEARERLTGRRQGRRRRGCADGGDDFVARLRRTRSARAWMRLQAALRTGCPAASDGFGGLRRRAATAAAAADTAAGATRTSGR